MKTPSGPPRPCEERNQKKRAAKEAKAAKKVARAAKAKGRLTMADLFLGWRPISGAEPELHGDATPPDAPLPDSCMASPPEEDTGQLTAPSREPRGA